MSTKKPPAAAAAEPIGYLESVRASLAKIPKKQWARIAVDSDVSPMTLYNVVKEQRDVKYSTAKKLYEVIQAFELAAAETAAKAVAKP